MQRYTFVVFIVFSTIALSFRLPTATVLIRSTRDHQKRTRCIVTVQSPSTDQFNSTYDDSIVSEHNNSIFTTGMTDRFQYKVC